VPPRLFADHARRRGHRAADRGGQRCARGGAFADGRRLRVSAKSDLGVAIATTGQAEAGQRETYRRIGDAITAMLDRTLLVRATVPSTFPMLLVTEAGGLVTDLAGAPWRPGSADILASAPALHAGALATLSTVD
jgi:myo-inositol-1(or 4)-monophosphatase